MPSPIYRILLWSGLLVGFGVRLFRLGAESLWYDETVSVYLAQQSVPALIAHTARDIHPPGYYLLLHLWQAVTQPTLQHGLEFLYAWPSLAAGMVLLPLLYALGRRWFGVRVALAALWIGALHPFSVWYSQEVRMYTVGAALCLVCLWAAHRWAEDGSTRQLVVYAVTGAAALYTLYYAAFALLAINLIIVVLIFQESSELSGRWRGRRLLHWVTAQVGVLVLWSPWLPNAWRQVTDPPVPPWRGELDILSALRESLSALLVGQSPPFDAFVLVIALFVLFGFTRKTVASRLWVYAYVFVPLAVILSLSALVTPLYHVRYFFVYAAAAPLLLAVALDVLARWRYVYALGIGALLALSAWSLVEFWENPLYRADDHRAAVQILATGWRLAMRSW
ncbi:MAG: glycosyltransferase family 39 protein [Caldilineaceae bacterium]